MALMTGIDKSCDHIEEGADVIIKYITLYQTAMTDLIETKLQYKALIDKYAPDTNTVNVFPGVVDSGSYQLADGYNDGDELQTLKGNIETLESQATLILDQIVNASTAIHKEVKNTAIYGRKVLQYIDSQTNTDDII